MKNRILPFIVALSALSVSGSATFYSVFGLSKLFAGAAKIDGIDQRMQYGSDNNGWFT